MATLIPIEWMQSDRRLDCPCCGHSVLNESGRVVSDPCSHFLFHWDGDLGGFDDCDDVTEHLLGDSVDFSVENAVHQLPTGIELLQIEVRDHACGPIQQTDYVAFNQLNV
ncbi:MAG: hypothetical protein AAFN77_15575 [Planctomycetota bacterium]